MFDNVMQLAKSRGRLAVREKLEGFGKRIGSQERFSLCLNFMVNFAKSQHVTIILTKATLKTFNKIIFLQ